MVSLGGLSQNSGYQDRSPERSPGTSSHTYPGEMKMNDEKTVSNENVFQTRFLVCCLWNVIVSCFHASLPFHGLHNMLSCGIWYTDVVL